MNGGIGFLLGAAVGGAAAFIGTWKYWERKSREIEDAAVESCRKAFNRPRHTEEPVKPDVSKDETPKEPTPEEIEEYKEAAAPYTPPFEEDEDEPTGRYIIAPFEFGNRDYEEKSFTYYPGGQIEDEDGHLLTSDEIEDTIGADAINHFGEYEEDSVFIRNDDMGYDYELLRSVRPYFDPAHPYDFSGEEE